MLSSSLQLRWGPEGLSDLSQARSYDWYDLDKTRGLLDSMIQAPHPEYPYRGKAMAMVGVRVELKDDLSGLFGWQLETQVAV